MDSKACESMCKPSSSFAERSIYLQQKNLLTWLTEEAIATGNGPELVVSAVLASNFVAIHTSSIVREFPLTVMYIHV